MIYCFCLNSTLKPPTPTPSFLCLSDRLQRTQQRRRVSSRAQSAAGRSSTMSTRRSNWWRTCWWESHDPSLSTPLRSDWAPIGRSTRLETSGGLRLSDNLSVCLPPHLLSQTLKDYQRRLDTSGLKPSNELYTEYKVSQQTRRWHLHCCEYTLFFLIFGNEPSRVL